LKKYFGFSIVVFGLIILVMPIPNYVPTYSKSLYSKDKHLLSASVSSEQQWCLPIAQELPEKFAESVLLFEDEYFYYHLGINPVSITKALITNIKEKRKKRGASTIPMQVMRMKNKNAKRNVWNKTTEALSAIKYSIFNKKSTILKEWAQIAPFGGNTIGAQSAAIRYFGRDLHELSWSEYALLAVMPNSPTTSNLRNNREKLKAKRDFLLKKLHQNKHFSFEDLGIFIDEDLPFEVKNIPQQNIHLLQFLAKKYPKQNLFVTTCTYHLQKSVNEIIEKESEFLKIDDIRNAAAIVIDVQSNELLAYTGNVQTNNSGKQNYVDIIQAPRSYGSLLKPLLYGYAIESGQVLPKEMILDIPTSIGDFRPMNFDKKFRGAVRLDEMVIQSLNVPSVRLLNSVGLPAFYDFIKQLDIAYLNKGADHYGLSIILGGGESNLWDLARVYKGLSQNYMGIPYPFRPIKYLQGEKEKHMKNNVSFSPATILPLVETMADLSRPREEKFWERFGPENKIAWKTGTSYGHRDAWALGFNGKYMVGVWVGNENGEGRHDLTGISKAAPILFKIFNQLPENKWFGHSPQYQKKQTISVCTESGKIAGSLCKQKEKKYIDNDYYTYQQCNYHQEIWLNAKNQMLKIDCKSSDAKKDTVFVLPPYVEYFYKTTNINYRGLPPLDANCTPKKSQLKIIYPENDLKIFIPKISKDKVGGFIARAYHNQKNGNIFWFVDDQHIKTTFGSKEEHTFSFSAPMGLHQLTINDQWGNSDQIWFEILSE